MGAFELVVSEGPNKGQTFAFPAERFVIGSAPECELRFDPSLVQPRHAEVSVEGDVVSVRDLTNNSLVWLNGESRPGGTVGPGGFIRFGRLELVVRQAGLRSPSGTISTPTPYRAPEPVRSASKVSGSRPLSGSSGPAPASNAPKPPTPLGRSLPPSGSVSELAPGTTIDGRYLIIGKLAAGGMGEVYKAEHVELGKLFAIKVMLPELSRDAEFVARFKREAISASRIGQQNIVDISDFGQTNNGRFYFVMEFLDGLTLASVTHREGAVRVERVLNIAVQVTRALAAAHAQGIVHRDLKPENIMLLQRPGQADFVKVLDFGVAKVAAGLGQGGHTAIGMVVGTPQYMSPEQAKAVPVDSRSDIYSLGLIFYELLTGRPTFSAETPSMFMVKHVTEAPPPFEPGEMGEVPVELAALIFKMLEKEPDARPQTMEGVVTALDTMWTRLKANDPTLKRISSALAEAKTVRGNPVQRGPLATDAAKAARATKTPARPSKKQKPVVEPEASPEDSARFAPESSSAGELAVSRSVAPYVVLVVLVIIAGAGLFVLRGASSAAVVPADAPPEDAPQVAVAEPEPKAVEVKTPEPEVAKPAPQTVTLKIESTPPAANVSEGDASIGQTPLSLQRPVDSKVTLTFSSPGFEPKTQTLGFLVSSKVAIELKREAKPSPKPVRRKPESQPTDDLKENPFQ